MSNPPDEKKSLKKDVFLLFTGGLGASVFAVVEVALLARFLGLEQFGIFSLVLSYAGFVNNLLDFKISEASVKYISEYRQRGDNKTVLSFTKIFYLADLLSGIVAFAVCILLAGAANSLFIKSEGSFQYVLIMSLSLLFSTVNQNSHAILQSLKKFRASAFFNTFNTFIRLVLIVAAFVSGFGLKGFFAAYVIAAVINFAALQFYVHKSLASEGLGGWISADLGRIRAKTGEALWFSANAAVSNFASLLFSANIPILLLGYFSGAEASALFKVARSFIKVTEKISGPVQSAVYPALVRAFTRGSYAEFRDIIFYSSKETAKFLVPVSIFFLLFAEQIIKYIFGVGFIPASGAMRVMVFAKMLSIFSLWTASAQLALGMPGLRTVLAVASSFLTLLSMFFLIPVYSYMGAAYAILIPEALAFVVSILMMVHISRRV